MSEPFTRCEVADDRVALVELCRPPNNFFSVSMLEELAGTFERLAAHPGCRAIVLCAQGKHFCAGADFTAAGGNSAADLYAAAGRLFRAPTPIVAAVQGAAVGGGLGLALVADFRVAAPEARFSANFARLGFHHGFGLSVTLPALVGAQRAAELLYTGRRVTGNDAVEMGLADRLARARSSAMPPVPWRSTSRPRRRSPSGRSARRCAAISRSAWSRPPSTSGPNRNVCSGPPTSPRACARRPSAATPCSTAGERGGDPAVSSAGRS